MGPGKLSSILNLTLRCGLGLIFITAAVSKLFDVNQFASRVGDFGIVEDSLVKATAWAVVAAELLIGVALVFRWRGSLLSAAGMLSAFIAILTYGVMLGLDVDCGCFGPAVHLSLATQLLVDCGLLTLCAMIYATEPRNDPPSAPDNQPAQDSPTP